LPQKAIARNQAPGARSGVLLPVPGDPCWPPVPARASRPHKTAGSASASPRPASRSLSAVEAGQLLTHAAQRGSTAQQQSPGSEAGAHLLVEPRRAPFAGVVLCAVPWSGVSGRAGNDRQCRLASVQERTGRVRSLQGLLPPDAKVRRSACHCAAAQGLEEKLGSTARSSRHGWVPRGWLSKVTDSSPAAVLTRCHPLSTAATCKE